MKRVIHGIIVLLLLAGTAGAQEVTPLPSPPNADVMFSWSAAAPPMLALPGTFVGAPFAQMRAPTPTPTPGRPGPPDLGKWWKNSEVVRQLQLSEAQINQLEQAFLDHRLKLIDLHAAVEREETRLQPLIEADQLDEVKVSAQLDAVLAARAKLEKQNTMMMLSLRKVLTVEQWKKLQAMHEERQRIWQEQGPQPPQPPQPPGAPPASAPRPPRPEV